MTVFRTKPPALIRAQDDLARELARKQDYERCAECGGYLGLRRWWDGWWMLFCRVDPNHRGFKVPRRKSPPPYGISYMRGYRK